MRVTINNVTTFDDLPRGLTTAARSRRHKENPAEVISRAKFVHQGARDQPQPQIAGNAAAVQSSSSAGTSLNAGFADQPSALAVNAAGHAVRLALLTAWLMALDDRLP
jgi:hypothetical protein